MIAEELEQRVKAVERLTALYRPERTVHMIANVVSLVVLLGSASVMLYQQESRSPVLVLMFGSSGLIAYTTSQVLRMWDRAISVISPSMGSKS
jgi:hypothetical protein